MNKNKKLVKTMAVVVSGALMAQSGSGYVYAKETGENMEQKASVEKEETVYVKADANGEKEDVIVSEWLKNTEGGESIADTSELSSIENVKGEEGFTQNGEKLVWDAGGNDIYYQGTTNRELPVGVEITYYLDGEKVTPEELAGKSGHVKIRYQYKNMSQEGDIYTPFVMVTGMVLPGENFKNTSVTNGKVISDGEKTIVIGIGLPGMYDSLKLGDSEELKDMEIPDSFEIEADAADFEIAMAMTVADPLNLEDLDLDDIGDVDDLREKINDLTDGSAELVDGSGELADGVQTLKDSCGELIDGIDTIDENMGILSDGIQTLDTKKADLISGINALTDGIDMLESKKGELVQGVQELNEGGKELKEGAKEARNGSRTLSKSTKLILEGVKELAGGEGSQKLQSGSKQLVSGSKVLKDGSASLADGIETMLKQADEKQLLAGAQQLQDGSAEFAERLAAYTSGVDSLVNALSASDETDPSKNGYMESVNQYIAGVDALLDALEASGANTGAAGAEEESVKQESEPAAAKTTQETVVKTTISDQSIGDIQSVLAELQGVQALLGGSSPQDLLAMADQYPAYVAKLENCIDLLGDSLGGIQQENIEITTIVQNTEEQEPSAEQAQSMSYGDTIAQLRAAGAALKAQSTGSTDPQNPTIQNAIEALTGNTSLDGVEMPVSAALITSAETIAAGTSQLNAGVQEVFYGVQDQLLPGAKQLASGAADLYNGSSQLNEGLGTLFAGTDTLQSNMNKLAEGAASLAGGNQQLYLGAAALANGTGQLNSGANILASGIGQLSSGGSALRSGADALGSGISELADGSSKLKDGTSELAEGGTKLGDGVEELKDGADELKEGMEKLDEEGIQEIADAMNEDVLDTIERLEQIRDAGMDYRLFGDSSTAGDGKFIFTIDSIEAE